MSAANQPTLVVPPSKDLVAGLADHLVKCEIQRSLRGPVPKNDTLILVCDESRIGRSVQRSE